MGRSSIDRFLKACELTLKKSHCMPPEQQRRDVAAAREVWRDRQPSLDPDRLVFIDETWATTNMTRLYGSEFALMLPRRLRGMI